MVGVGGNTPSKVVRNLIWRLSPALCLSDLCVRV